MSAYVPQPYNELLDSPVSYASQTLTDPQKAQALTNLGAASVAYVGANFAPISHNHSADNITSGALAKARQHAQTAYLDEAQTFTAKPTFGLGADFPTGFRVFDGTSWGSFYGNDGTLETDWDFEVDGSLIADDLYVARINDVTFANFARKDASNTFSQAQTFSSIITINSVLFASAANDLVLVAPTSKSVFLQAGVSVQFGVTESAVTTYVPFNCNSTLNIGSTDCRLFRDNGNLYVESDGTIIFRDTSSSSYNMSIANGVLRVGDTSGKPMIAPSYDGDLPNHFPCGLVVERSSVAIGLAWGMYQNDSASWASGWNYAPVPRTALLNNFDGLRYIATASTTATPGTVLPSQPTTVFSVTPSGVVTGELLKGPIDPRPITKAALLTLSATATSGEHRITDSTPAQRRAYPDGTNWRYSDDSTIVT